MKRRRFATTQTRLLVFLHLSRRMLGPVAGIAICALVATIIVRWDMARSGEEPLSFGETLYSMYMQVFFEPAADLPKSAIARAVFWLTPVVGTVLIAEGVAKVGASLLDKDERRKLWVTIMANRMHDHVVVCGLGHVGYRVVEALERLGVPVLAIERKEEGFLESVRALDVPVMVGDARRDELLIEAGIERARAVVCATNDDLANLEVALDSKRMNPKIRVVMRMFDQRLANKVGGALDLDETFSTSALVAPLVALQATQTGVRSVYTLEDGTVHSIVEVEHERAPAEDRATIGALEDALDVRVVGVVTGGVTKRPRSADAVTRGMKLLIDVSAERLVDVLKALRGA